MEQRKFQDSPAPMVETKTGEQLIYRLRDAASEQFRLINLLTEKVVSLTGEFRDPSPKGPGEQSERVRASFSKELDSQITEVELNNNYLVMALDRLNQFV